MKSLETNDLQAKSLFNFQISSLNFVTDPGISNKRLGYNITKKCSLQVFKFMIFLKIPVPKLKSIANVSSCEFPLRHSALSLTLNVQ